MELAIKMMRDIRGFKDAEQLANQYEEQLDQQHKSWVYYRAKEYIRDAERCVDQFDPDNEDRENAARYYRYALDELNSIPGYSDADQLARRVEKKARRLENRKKRIAIWLLSILAIIAALVFMFVYIIPSCDYADAEKLYAKGDYFAAAEKFRLLKFKDSDQRYLDAMYKYAESCLSTGDTTDAMFAFGTIFEYEDARERSLALWENYRMKTTIEGTKIHATMAHIKNDGTIRISGYDDKAFFANVVDIAKTPSGCYALNQNGQVEYTNGTQTKTLEWTDIVDIEHNGSDYHGVLFGLKLDGTVVNTEKSDEGTYGFKNIIAISASPSHVIGLTADGTVMAGGDNDHGQLNVSEWTDIVAVEAGSNFTAGLKADGTVLIAGDLATDYGTETSSWENIVKICATESSLLGLKADGTVVCCGKNTSGCLQVDGWTDIVALAGNECVTVGLKEDGTVVIVGDKYYSNYDEVHDWTDIRVPAQPKKEETEQ